tara:strand:+ start:336 stop:464 length:129 start_codon:yes stop_codon:yes gene_type:complete
MPAATEWCDVPYGSMVKSILYCSARAWLVGTDRTGFPDQAVI